jgi:hypothetical protein
MHPFVRWTLAIMLIVSVKQQLIFLTNSSSTTSASTADAFGVAPRPVPRSNPGRGNCRKEDVHVSETRVPQLLSRTKFMVGLLPVFLVRVPAARATDELKGTKKDPVYEACLSQCMYTCTKPKGEEQKSRTLCLSECKVQCATTKQQLMLGTPLSSSP